jgi:nitrite reductase (cytochrome c-552)
MEIAMDNLAKAHLETGKAMESGASDQELEDIREHIRHGQWRWDYAIASHGSFFHAPEETLRILASANDEAQKARIKLVGLLAKHKVFDYIAPDFSSKEKAQKLAGVPLQQLIEAKLLFKATLEKEWDKQAVQEGNLNMSTREDVDLEASYFKK